VDLQELYEHIEKHRVETVEQLVKKYRTISPLLGKVGHAKLTQLHRHTSLALVLTLMSLRLCHHGRVGTIVRKLIPLKGIPRVAAEQQHTSSTGHIRNCTDVHQVGVALCV
jgi:hypothetical protein